MKHQIIAPPSYGRRPCVGLSGTSAAATLRALLLGFSPTVLLMSDFGLLDNSDLPISVIGTDIKTWQDQSGNGNHAVQAVNANQLVWNKDQGTTGLTPNLQNVSANGSRIPYMEGPFVDSGTGFTGIAIGFDFVGGPWVSFCAGTTGLTDISATAIRTLENIGVGTLTQNRATQNATSTPVNVEAGVKRSLYTTQLTGANLTFNLDGTVQSVAATPTLGTTVYGLFNNPNKAGTTNTALWVGYCFILWNTVVSAPNLATIQAALKSYYNTT